MSENIKVSKKILLIGDPGVGKTSLVRKFVYDIFDDKYLSTFGTKVTHKQMKISNPNNDSNIDLSLAIWDIMGQDEFQMFHQTAFKGSKGAFLICDLTRRDTLESLLNWITRLYKVTNEIPVVLIGNKCDLSNKIQFQIKDINDILSSFNFPVFLASAKTGKNVESSFHTLGRNILSKFL